LIIPEDGSSLFPRNFGNYVLEEFKSPGGYLCPDGLYSNASFRILLPFDTGNSLRKLNGKYLMIFFYLLSSYISCIPFLSLIFVIDVKVFRFYMSMPSCVILITVRWRQYVLSKRRPVSARLHGDTSKNRVLFKLNFGSNRSHIVLGPTWYGHI
jgi:hypothetical protein